ncbi:MAG: DNA ligase D, partial [Alphaproteobacteria bacterium]|nr:DNA ligase D [Alphaproteobacteria bacterium]
DPAAKRLAVEVEDHPLDYGDFEGVIPKGEYGGGTVLIWDRGYWAPEPSVDPVLALKAGELKFVVAGERLNGGYVLVRLRRREREKRNNWLLIKHHDEFAREGGGDVTKSDTSIASGRAMEAIASGKGRKPKAFMLARSEAADAVWQSNRTETKKKAKPLVRPSSAKRGKKGASSGARGLSQLPSFIEPQFCRLEERPPSGEGWGHEVKFDGYRMQMRIEGGETSIRTRRGLDWTEKFGAIARAGKKLGDGVLDGEIVALDVNDAPCFAGLQAALSGGKTDKLVFYAFDLLFEGDEDLRPLLLAERKARLEKFVEEAAPVIQYTGHLDTAGDAVLQAACRMSLEGVVSKRLDAPYTSGRSNTWIKSKCRGGQEVVIGGWMEENGRFRSLLAGVHQGGHLVYVGKVGTGYGQKVVEQIFPRLKAAATDRSPFSDANAPKKTAGVRWARPELVAEIAFAGWTGDHHLRQASFKGLRDDKTPTDITIEKPKSPTPATPQMRAPKRTVVLGVSISSADKTLWPKDAGEPAFTKLDLANYFEHVGERMLPHIRGRPCSFVRMPDGIAGETFFQRHAMKGASNLFTLSEVAGEKKPYLQVDCVEGLIAAAQIAALELHPWNCQPFQTETPGRLVFDLDPAPDVPFARVIAGAKEVRDRLNALGLEAFCKTTGGKGLHVVTPLLKTKQEIKWPEAKGFAQELCRQMASDSPDRYLIKMAKEDRVGRIFLDYLRNDRTATAVAPLSPRGRSGAPVSMPIAWSQVRAGFDPARYSIRTVPRLLTKADPWEDYCDAERPFHVAARKLLKAQA